MNGHRESILVVDDDSEVLDALKNELSDYFDVTALLSAEQALSRLETQSFAAIISDVRMPGIDGLTLIKECAQRYPDMVRIILTAFNDQHVHDTALSEAGAFKLIKPWGDDLLVTLRNALAQRRSKIDLQKTLELGDAAMDIDTRLHLHLPPHEVLPAAISEMQRVPGVLDITVYTFDEDGHPRPPVVLGDSGGREPLPLTKKRQAPPEPHLGYHSYAVSVGEWPRPYAACLCRLSTVSDTTIRFLDFIGRQAYRTLLIVDPQWRHQETLGLDVPSPQTTCDGNDPNTLCGWIRTTMAVPATAVVSAADQLRTLTAQLPPSARAVIEEVAADLDAAYAAIDKIVLRIR